MVGNAMAIAEDQSAISVLVSFYDTWHCWPFVGGILPRRPGFKFVLTGPDGSVRVVAGGPQLLQGLPGGSYTWQWVDVRCRRLQLPAVSALTQDGLRASLQVCLVYQVSSPARVVALDDPVALLHEAAVHGITAVIGSTPHDVLAGIAGPLDGHLDDIASQIRRRVGAHLRGTGLAVLDAFILDRQGDAQHLEIARQRNLAVQQLTTDQALVPARYALEAEQRRLVLFQAETLRKQAEEEQKISLERARLEALTHRLLRASREWDMRLALVPEAYKQRHEQNVATIEAYGQILGKMAEPGSLEMAGVSSRRRPEISDIAPVMNTLLNGMDKMQLLTNQGPDGSLAAVVDTANGDADSLLPCLAHEIVDLATIDGATLSLKPVTDGNLELVVEHNSVSVGITCASGFPSVPPQVAILADDGRWQPWPLPWPAPVSLKDLVLRALESAGGQDWPAAA